MVEAFTGTQTWKAMRIDSTAVISECRGRAFQGNPSTDPNVYTEIKGFFAKYEINNRIYRIDQCYS